MTRWLLPSLLVLVGCSSETYRYEGTPKPVAVNCAAQKSCGTCTPVLGCGWCSFGDGNGKCASSPSACGSTFRWNWDPPDCPTEPDAGSVDAASPAEASVEETSSATCRTPSSVGANCALTSGGTLCGSTQYTVGCHDGGKPEATLGCAAATSTSSGTFHCCPCLP